jgi:hypothetical protein
MTSSMSGGQKCPALFGHDRFCLASSVGRAHSRSVESIVLERRFRVWTYGVGHSQLLLRSPSMGSQAETMHVLFEGVRAVKLRTSHDPLELRAALGEDRLRLLDFAGIPERLHDKFACITLPSEDDGFIVCGRATVFAVPGDVSDSRWQSEAQVLHDLRPGA